MQVGNDVAEARNRA